MEHNNDNGQINTIKKSIKIIDIISQHDGARVTEIAENLGMAPSTVHGHLATLERNEYLVKEGDIYHVGLKFLQLGGRASHRREEYKQAIEKVHTLAMKTNERAQFIVEEHGKGVYLHTATGEHAVQVNARIGKQSHLHASAAGKAILAFLPERRRAKLLDEISLVPLTENTITDRNQLLEELETIRDRGYSYNKEESITGLQAVGAPLLLDNESPIGAFSISGPTHRLKGVYFEKELPDLLLGTTNELRLNLQYP